MSRICMVLVLFGVLAPSSTYAQAHFTGCLDGTGNVFNAVIIIPAASRLTIDGTPLSQESEIAIFSSDPLHASLCVGMVIWQGVSTHLVIWGDDDLTSVRDGLVPGEAWSIRVWDAASGAEYEEASVRIGYEQGEGAYENNALRVLSDVDIRSMFVATEPRPEVPERVQVYTNYPNPFRDETTISYGLPQSSHVTIAIYDVLGRLVVTLLDEMLAAGWHEVAWDGGGIRAGLYLCRIQADGRSATHALTIIK